jgi:hypothetical protein
MKVTLEVLQENLSRFSGWAYHVALQCFLAEACAYGIYGRKSSAGTEKPIRGWAHGSIRSSRTSPCEISSAVLPGAVQNCERDTPELCYMY